MSIYSYNPHPSELDWEFRLGAAKSFRSLSKRRFYAYSYGNYKALLEYVDFERAYMMGGEL